MAEPEVSRTVTQYGARQPDGTELSYGTDKISAAEAATMTGCELVTCEATFSPWVVIPNPLLEGGGGSPSGVTP